MQDCISKVPFWSKSTLAGSMTIHLSTFLISSLYTELHTTWQMCNYSDTHTLCHTQTPEQWQVICHVTQSFHDARTNRHTHARMHAVCGCWLWWWGLVLCRRECDDLSLIRLMFANADVHKRGTLTRQQVYIRQSAFLLKSIVQSGRCAVLLFT